MAKKLKSTSIKPENIKSRRIGLGTFGFEVILLATGILLFSIAFPGFLTNDGIPVLGFIALVPMFALVRVSSWKKLPAYAILYGLTKYVIFNYWLSSFHPGAIFIAPIICMVELLFTFPILKLLDRAFPKYGFIFMAVAFIGYEYIKSLGFVGYPYGIIGYSVYTFLPFIQIAEITGVWGVSLMITLPSAFLGRLLVDWYEARLPLMKRTVSGQVPFLAVYGALLIAVLTFGFVRLHQVSQWEVARDWNVALVQHNADTWEGGFQQYQRNFEALSRLTLEALEEAPETDIVVWSETAFVPGVYWHATYRTNPQMYQLVARFEDFAKGLDVPLVTGNSDGQLMDPSLPPVLPDNTLNRADYNAVIHYEAGELQEIYRKLHLVPFTEHFPYEEQLPRFYALLRENEFNFWETGEEVTVFETKDGVQFSTPICFEDVFGYLSRKFVNEGAEVIVNLTNDSWSRAVSAQMQHYTMSIYRTIETRRSLVRGTNSGMTATLDAGGNLIDMLEPFIESYMISSVPIYKDPPTTFYLKYGDWLAQASLGFTLALSAAAGALMFRRRKS